VGLWLAAAQLDLPERPQAMVASVLKTLGILVWTAFAMRFVSLLLKALSSMDKVDMVETRTRPLFDNLAKIVLIAGAVYFVFISWNINVSAWLASAGIIGLALGFAAKDSLANLFSGIFILADAPYKIGDYINLDSGERGEVTQIGLRSTRLLTRDDVEITVPNAVIANAKIINETGGPSAKQRIRIKVGVAYGSDVDLLREVLTEIATNHLKTCNDPAPRVRFRSFGDSSLDFELLCWIDEPWLRGQVTDALNTEVYKRLRKEKIEIPYPKRDVYIKQMPGTESN
jgi:small-conductance mechanosensitive channel